jgi:hypothetical protein
MNLSTFRFFSHFPPTFNCYFISHDLFSHPISFYFILSQYLNFFISFPLFNSLPLPFPATTDTTKTEVEAELDDPLPNEVMMALCRVFSGVLKRDSNLYLMSGRYDPVIGMGMGIDNVSGVKSNVCVCGVVCCVVLRYDTLRYVLLHHNTYYNIFHLHYCT